MLVIVMAEMLGSCTTLMSAISRRRRPRGLHGDEDKKKDGEPATHGRDHSRMFFVPISPNSEVCGEIFCIHNETL